MAEFECPRESETLFAAGTGHVAEELRAHVEGCTICADLLLVAQSVSADRDAAWREAHPPAAGLMWWRMQLRLRRETIASARRTVAIVQGVVIAAAVAAAIAILFLLSPSTTWLSSIVNAASKAVLASPSLLALIAFFALAPLATYFALREER